jgi:hypothetical protein
MEKQGTATRPIASFDKEGNLKWNEEIVAKNNNIDPEAE